MDTLVVDTPFNGAPLLAYGSIYIGDVEGTVYKIDPETLAIEATYDVGSAVATGPTAGPGGRVLVVTSSGMLVSLTSGLTLHWQKNLGSTFVNSIPAASVERHLPGLRQLPVGLQSQQRRGAMEAQRRLEQLWAPASVGYGREVYIQTVNGTVEGLLARLGHESGVHRRHPRPGIDPPDRAHRAAAKHAADQRHPR
jgi:hypothetical protein